MGVQIPIDFERISEFRKLERLCDGAGDYQALAAYVRLYVELAYLAQSGNQLGRATRSDLEIYADGFGPKIIDHLVQVGLLRRDTSSGGDGEVFWCDRFARDNRHLAPGSTNMHERGWLASKLARAQRKAEGESLQLALMIPKEYFMKDGKEFPAETCNRIQLLIRSLDSVMLAPHRQEAAFTETLIHDAHKVVSSKSEHEITSALQRLVKFRKHPRVQSLTTEDLLQDWDNTVGKIGA